MITNFKIFEKSSDITWGMFQNNTYQVMSAINDGEDVNTQDGNGQTALMFMAKRVKKTLNYNEEFFHLIDLIGMDADWNLKDKHNLTFIDYLKNRAKFNDVFDRIIEMFPEKYQEYKKLQKVKDFNL